MLRKYGKEYLESEESYAGANNWIGFIANKMHELGYKKVETINVNFWGAFIIDDVNDDEDKEWGKVVGKKLLLEAINHNKIIKNS